MKMIVLLVILCLGFLAMPAYAHPPSRIDVAYDTETRILSATIVHPVENPSNHYIKKVDVALNGKEIIEQEISRQDTDTSQTVSYLVPDAKPGDTLSVEGYCSIVGTKTQELKVE